ncbi:MAG TPA: hypothetical protein VL096_03775 [Pirellulaceae bacterium]|nr:hypothetical protein [Pirellulaceae bacterium]
MAWGQISRREFGIVAASTLLATQVQAQTSNGVPVPGTGLKLDKIGDDFEDPDWKYFPQSPKSSDENDKRQRLPAGESKNNRWFEPIMRGQPDMVKRVTPPEGGVEGSTGALYMASIYPGIPGSPSGQVEQDDFCANVVETMGGLMPISWQPNCMCRVYVPPVEKWENRIGASFGYRLGVLATHNKKKTNSPEEYWPGMFFRMENKVVEKTTKRVLRVQVRANEYGHDVPGPVIEEPGWYTLGMSLTSNGAVHYFFRPGVESLTAENRIASHYPYGYRIAKFETFFFNVLARDSGRTWSTPWIVDDAFLYLSSPPRHMIASGKSTPSR